MAATHESIYRELKLLRTEIRDLKSSFPKLSRKKMNLKPSGKVKRNTKQVNMSIGNESLETAIASESSLKKEWLRPEEDEAWQDL